MHTQPFLTWRLCRRVLLIQVVLLPRLQPAAVNVGPHAAEQGMRWSRWAGAQG